MTKKLFALVLASALLHSSSAAAKMELFPIWEEKECNGVTMGCYSFDKAKEIVKIDLQLQLRLKRCEAWEEEYPKLQLAFDNLHKAYDLSLQVRDRLEKRNLEKTKTIEDLAAKTYKMSNRDVFGGALPWVVVLMLLTFTGGVVAGVKLGS